MHDVIVHHPGRVMFLNDVVSPPTHRGTRQLFSSGIAWLRFWHYGAEVSVPVTVQAHISEAFDGGAEIHYRFEPGPGGVKVHTCGPPNDAPPVPVEVPVQPYWADREYDVPTFIRADIV